MARGRSSGLSKGSPIQRPFTGDSWPKTMVRSMNSTGRQYPPVPETIFHRGYEWNTTRDTTPPMYLTRTGIRLKSSTKASEELHIGKMVTPRLGNKHRLRSSDRSSGHHRVQVLE